MVFNPLKFGRRLTGYAALLAGASGSTLLDGLVSWWDLDEESGVRADAVGSNDLTDNNTVGFAAGKIGNAASAESLSFACGTTLDGTITISIWVKLAKPGTDEGFLSIGDTPLDGTPMLILQQRTNEIIRAYHGSGYSTGIAMSDNEWHHVVWTFDSATNAYQLIVDDGASSTSGTIAQSNSNGSNNFYIGAGFNGYADGELDLAGVWSRVLTSDEITELYNLGASIKNDFTDNGEGFREGLEAYWDLDEESGTRYDSNILDLSTNLVAYWKMDEAAGATRVDSVGSYDLAETNTTDQNAGKRGKAAGFTNANQSCLEYVPASPDGLWPSSDFTLAFWLKHAAYGTGKIFINALGHDNNGGIFSLDAGGKFSIYIKDGTSTTGSCDASGAAGRWQHIAYVYNSTDGKCYLYMDGEQVDEAVASGGLRPQTPPPATWTSSACGTGHSLQRRSPPFMGEAPASIPSVTISPTTTQSATRRGRAGMRRVPCEGIRRGSLIRLRSSIVRSHGPLQDGGGLTRRTMLITGN
jgi:hypothetical protein